MRRPRAIHADADDFTDELMPHDRRHRDGLLLQGVPFVNIQVRTADASLADIDEDIIDADQRRQDILEPGSALRIGFDESLHG